MNSSLYMPLTWSHLCFAGIRVGLFHCCCPHGLHGCTGRARPPPSTLGHNLSCLFHLWEPHSWSPWYPISFWLNEGLSQSTVSLSCNGEQNASSKDKVLPISHSYCTAISALWFFAFPKVCVYFFHSFSVWFLGLYRRACLKFLSFRDLLKFIFANKWQLVNNKLWRLKIMEQYIIFGITLHHLWSNFYYDDWPFFIYAYISAARCCCC